MHYHTHRPGEYNRRNRGGRRHDHHWRGGKHHRWGRSRHYHDGAGRGILSQRGPQQ